MEISINIETDLEDAEREILSYLSSCLKDKAVIMELEDLRDRPWGFGEDKLERLKKIKEELVYLDKKLSSTINTIKEVKRTKRQIKDAGERVLINNYQQNSKQEGEEDE